MHEITQNFSVKYSYPVCFTRGVLELDNPLLRDIIARAGLSRHRVLPVIDSGIMRCFHQLSEQLQQYADAHRDVIELIMPPLLVRGGEICKSDPREVDEFYTLTQQYGLCRHSFVLVIGGGSVIDAIGYAAATVHRGLRLIRMPTTVLAQNDAGIGVKNAVNYSGRKNYLGTFTLPFAVINDFDFLETLSARDRRAGMAEAVKVALIKDREFFDWLYRERHCLAAFEHKATETLVTRCAELHLQHTQASGDPFEQGSARPLDFGHWSAHRLEELSQADLRHGEAVAIGVALDSLYSNACGMIDDADLDLILSILKDLGFNLYHPKLAELDIGLALEDFREHLGGRLCITVLAAIGRGIEIHEVDLDKMTRCVERLRMLA